MLTPIVLGGGSRKLVVIRLGLLAVLLVVVRVPRQRHRACRAANRAAGVAGGAGCRFRRDLASSQPERGGAPPGRLRALASCRRRRRVTFGAAPVLCSCDGVPGAT